MDLLTLTIDTEFKNLIPKLRQNEYLQLESNIMTDGCREPITTWHGIIVDGHNRYEICHRHRIPFQIREMEFDCREAVIAWICSNQLGRRNISEECRKYLIGVQYHTAKIAASKRNARGINQYTVQVYYDGEDDISAEISHRTAHMIAEEHHIAHGTVQKYASYSKALDEISKHEPKLAAKIKSGNYKISHKNVVEMSKLSPDEIRKINRRIDRNPTPFIRFKHARSAIAASKAEVAPPEESQGPSVKDMPEFDPDAEISSLALTIPSWASSIERTRSRADLSIVSDAARHRLIGALSNLQDSVSGMITAIEEETK